MKKTGKEGQGQAEAIPAQSGLRLWIAPEPLTPGGERLVRIMQGSTVLAWRTFLTDGSQLILDARVWFEEWNKTSKADVVPAQGGQHTPRPWKFGGANSWAIYSAATGKEICRMSTAGKMDQELMANIAIITAAPERLEALKELLPCEAHIHSLRAAGHPVSDNSWLMLHRAAEAARAAIARAEGRGQ